MIGKNRPLKNKDDDIELCKKGNAFCRWRNMDKKIMIDKFPLSETK